MACYTKKTLYKISLLEKKKKESASGLRGVRGTILIYILTLIWSTYNRVLGSFLWPLILFSNTHTRTQTHLKRKQFINRKRPCSLLTFAPSELFCTRCSLPLQSHISSGSSWGLRMPGTDIWSLCFSSWAWRSAVSLSSKNRSVVSSPANSCRTTQAEDQQRSHRGFGL